MWTVLQVLAGQESVDSHKILLQLLACPRTLSLRVQAWPGTRVLMLSVSSVCTGTVLLLACSSALCVGNAAHASTSSAATMLKVCEICSYHPFSIFAGYSKPFAGWQNGGAFSGIIPLLLGWFGCMMRIRKSLLAGALLVPPSFSFGLAVH